MPQTIIVPADLRSASPLTDAERSYIAEHPRLEGWDLEPRWVTKAQIGLIVPKWHVISLRRVSLLKAVVDEGRDRFVQDPRRCLPRDAANDAISEVIFEERAEKVIDAALEESVDVTAAQIADLLRGLDDPHGYKFGDLVLYLGSVPLQIERHSSPKYVHLRELDGSNGGRVDALTIVRPLVQAGMRVRHATEAWTGVVEDFAAGEPAPVRTPDGELKHADLALLIPIAPMPPCAD